MRIKKIKELSSRFNRSLIELSEQKKWNQFKKKIFTSNFVKIKNLLNEIVSTQKVILVDNIKNENN